MLHGGEEISQHLGGVILVGKAVPDRHAGVSRQFFHNLLPVAAVFDAVVHATQDSGGVGDGFLFAHLAAGGAEIGDMRSLVEGGDFKGAACAGAVFFKDQGDVFALEALLLGAGVFGLLEVQRKVEQKLDLFGAEVHQREKMAVSEVERHEVSLCVVL